MRVDDSIFRRAADTCRVSATELKEEIQRAINQVYENPNDLAKTVPRKQAIPTAEEIIRFVMKCGGKK